MCTVPMEVLASIGARVAAVPTTQETVIAEAAVLMSGGGGAS
eukprot:SAG31_NODE_33627_length_341_cov_1.694215_1_plen_41_part_10